MAITPVSPSSPVSPLETLFNTGYTQIAADISAVSAVRQVRTYKWANAAARNSQAGMSEGDLGDQADTDQRWRYSGSAWVDITTGLFPVIPTSVAGSGVTLNASGKITFNTASTVSINGCFTSAYENYQIIMNVTSKSTGSNVQMRLRLAGTDATGASDYTSQRTYSNATTVVTARITANAWELEAGTLTTTDIDAKIFAPMLAARTRLNSLAIGSSDTVIYASSLGGRHLQSTGYDGASFLPTSGDMTGTLRIYGYNNL